MTWFSRAWLAWRQARTRSRMPLDNRTQLPAGWERWTAQVYYHRGWDIIVMWSPGARRWFWECALQHPHRHLLRDAAMKASVRYWSGGIAR